VVSGPVWKGAVDMVDFSVVIIELVVVVSFVAVMGGQ